MKDLISYIIFFIFSKVLRILPTSFCKRIGIAIGTIAYKLAKDRNKIIKKNLKKAFPKYSSIECEDLLKRVYKNVGMVLVEVILLEKLSKDELKDCISVEGEQYLKQIQGENKGIILYTAHFGNWEWLAGYIAAQGNPVSAIATRQSNLYFDKKINQIRSSKGINIITKGISLRKTYKRLLKGEFICILGDQIAGEHGWETTFFARKASTFNGTVRFAVHTGANILPVFIIREGWLKHKIVYYPSYNIGKDASEKEQRELLQELTSLTEEVIRENPDQWFWLHRRWKTR